MTGESVKVVTNCLNDHRVGYVDSPHVGRPLALNLALRRSTGEYIAYLDDDDLWYWDHLEATVGFLERRPLTGVMYSEAVRRTFRTNSDGSMKVVSSSLAPNWELTWSRLIDHNTIPILCLVHRKSLVHDVGYFRDLPAVEDWDMLLRLASVSEVAHVPRVTYEYYVNLNKQTGNESWRRQNPAAYLALVNAIREYQNPPIFLMDGQGVPSNRQELVRRLERFLSERPDCYGIWKTYGAELMQLREYNLALKALQMGLVARESDDQGRQLYRLISICYSHLQEPATAKACFTKSRQAVMGSTGANDAELPHLEGGALLDSISSAPLHGIVYYYLYSQRFGHRAALKKIAKHLQSKL